MTIHKNKSFYLLFFIILLLSIPILILMLYIGVHQTGLTPWWGILLILLPFIALPTIVWTMMQSVKIMGGKNKKIRIKASFSSIRNLIALLFAVISFAFAGFFVYALQNEKPPDFFPLNDPQATYTIVKRDDLYFVQYASTSDLNKHQDCTFTNEKRICKVVVNRNVETIVGESAVELEPYIGKNIILNGDFVSAKIQCIVGECQDIGSWAVFDIHSIKSN